MNNLFQEFSLTELEKIIFHEVSSLMIVLVFIFSLIILDKIKKKYKTVRELKITLFLVAVITIIWFVIEFVDFHTEIPVKKPIVNYFHSNN